MTPEFGTSIDVFPGGYALVDTDWLTIHLVIGETATSFKAEAAVERVLEIRAARADDGRVWMVAKSGATFGGVNRLLIIRDQQVIVTTHACVAQNGAILAWNVDHFVIWTQHTPFQALRLGLNVDGSVRSQDPIDAPPPFNTEGTSQGFLQVTPFPTPSDHELVWTAERPFVTLDDVRWRYPQMSDGVITGQYGADDHVGGLYADGTQILRFTAIAEPALYPRLAADGAGVHRIAAALPHGRVALALGPPWMPFDGSEIPVPSPSPARAESVTRTARTQPEPESRSARAARAGSGLLVARLISGS